METVEVVVRLPKEVYENIQEIYRIIVGRRNGKTIEFALWNGVKNGIVLPKGHGELKDVSNLLTVTDYDGENEKTYVLYDEIKHAPTIIAADKEAT